MWFRSKLPKKTDGLICARCHEPLPDFGLYVKFNGVEGEPIVCEPCLVENLGLGRPPWRAEIVRWPDGEKAS